MKSTHSKKRSPGRRDVVIGALLRSLSKAASESRVLSSEEAQGELCELMCLGWL